ncbi:Kef-type K+ transport system membrane component KefB [Kribbella orskensis]|uniref:Kef-type K+ transport system membrane component KefB n=1 Tax=Kribbella orskensis TaxID=2512216 RepID=A0ABY2BU80_9ACTN|nr:MULTISPECIES: cation:proton antiporter [Kribbella]TCN43056.1 Kef-type K+ transport system membrane component KefB [Kribbella sp. VKM Ac-2500]TCO29588.1 Kef-type K+ transport system membrane component KefB [Kribbella orskensis]
MGAELGLGLTSLFVVVLVAAVTPVLVGLLSRFRVPQVVVLILGGVVVGPQVLDLADPDSIELLANVGLGFLFLLAGYELELAVFRQRAGKLAIVGWVVTVALAGAVVGGLAALGLVKAFVPVALGLTTTALGTLLPILRDNNMLRGAFGPFVLAAGAVGEFLPVVAIAIFLGSNGRFIGLISLLTMGVLALLLSLVPRLGRGGRIARILSEGQHATSQTTLRWTVALLLLLLVVANDFGLDVVLGAFVAGVVLHRWAPGNVEALDHKLDAVGYGFFIPIFFVSSGMGLDVRSIVEAPARLLLFFLLLLVVRGLPTLLCTAPHSPGRDGSNSSSSCRRRCRCSSLSARSDSRPATCSRRTPPRWWARASCPCWCTRRSRSPSTAESPAPPTHSTRPGPSPARQSAREVRTPGQDADRIAGQVAAASAWRRAAATSGAVCRPPAFA